jgi:hypothetical protein
MTEQTLQKQIELLERKLSESKAESVKAAGMFDSLCNRVQASETARHGQAISVAMNIIGMCQHAMQPCVVGDAEGCFVDYRELLPEEGAMFSAACDMVSRYLDSQFPCERKRGPELDWTGPMDGAN